jgi:hypothetical protein
MASNGSDSAKVWTGKGPKPWWFDNAELDEIARRTMEEIEALPLRPPVPHEPDPILDEVFSRSARSELGAARDDLARAKSRYDEAIRRARDVGYSWGEIGKVLGVPRQLLHRRFARRLGSTRG